MFISRRFEIVLPGILLFYSWAEEEASEATLCLDTKRQKERAGNGNRSKHRDEDAETEDESEALDDRGAEPEEDDGSSFWTG